MRRSGRSPHSTCQASSASSAAAAAAKTSIAMRRNSRVSAITSPRSAATSTGTADAAPGSRSNCARTRSCCPRGPGASSQRAGPAGGDAPGASSPSHSERDCTLSAPSPTRQYQPENTRA